jgi:ferredoxin
MPTITFLKTNQTVEVPAGTSFLEYCQENDAPHDFGCTVGSCGTCVCVLEAGIENVDPMDDDEKDTLDLCTDKPNARLGCQLKVNGDISVRQGD